jgi:cytochrome bd-type quinol oxidase subunit 2
MTKKTKLLITFALILIFFTVGISQVFALNLTEKLTTVGTPTWTNEEPNIATTIGQIIKGLLSLLGVMFMIYVVYAGYLWMTASGEEEKISKAKTILKGSIIGLIIVLGAYAITYFVVTNVQEATGYQETAG